MRICLVSLGDATADPRAGLLVRSLEMAGHDVQVVCGGSPAPGDPSTVSRVPSRVPQGLGALGWVLRRLRPKGLEARSLRARFVATIAGADPELIYALSESAVPLAAAAARRCDAAVVRDPRLPSAGDRDIVRLAPDARELSSSPAGPGSTNHSRSDRRAPWTPRPGRHAGLEVVLAYRPTTTTPARYLHRALERAGIRVRHVADRLDWRTVGRGAAFVLFVESPYPAIEVVGENPGIPVLLWAHHGEHHTGAHLRLIRRYGVHAVLLAHSWHLAHRYPVPVHRFPFAVAPELLDGTDPWTRRPFDVGFVGSLGVEEGPYSVRRRLLDAIRSGFPDDRVHITDMASPEQLAHIYAHSKVVVDEGGARHYPITMRVFEAIGSGALLATTGAPGLSCLFDAHRHYALLDLDDPAGQIRRLLDDGGRSAGKATSALAYAAGRHWYDHRVDELVEIAAETQPLVAHGWERPEHESALADAVDAFVEIGSVALYGAPEAADELPLCATWRDPTPGARSYDAVVIGPTTEIARDAAAADAVRYVITDNGGEVRVRDLDAPGYHIRSIGAAG